MYSRAERFAGPVTNGNRTNEAIVLLGCSRRCRRRLYPLSGTGAAAGARDRLMFLADGMLERNAASVDIRSLMVEGAQMHPREAVQHVVLALLEAANGELKDDATARCRRLAWRPFA
jgi:hypothetical protein